MIVLSILIGAVVILASMLLLGILTRYADEATGIIMVFIGVPAVLYMFYIIGQTLILLFSA